jgi:DNA-binding response OmpR family regulator
VLVADDERKIRDTLRLFLEQQRYAVLQAGTGQEALDVAGRLKPDLVILDLMLPDLPGKEVARSLRTVSPVPIIMLTAKAEEADRVARLRLGADDYVVKPFSPLELVARVDAVLRRARPGGPAGLLSFDQGRLVIDQAARDVCLGGSHMALTRSEFDLLVALASYPGRAFSRGGPLRAARRAPRAAACWRRGWPDSSPTPGRADWPARSWLPQGNHGAPARSSSAADRVVNLSAYAPR